MIENEIKFVLRGYDELEPKLCLRYGWHDMDQGYLSSNDRIREITHQSGLITHTFDFKKRLPTGRNIELTSKSLTHDDFDDLWQHTSERLTKRRVTSYIYYTDHKDGLFDVPIRWDIDFFRWPSGNHYFVMAEVEMPADMDRPPFILADIEPYIVFEVPREDNRFSARKLSDDSHAKRLAQSLGLWRADA